MEQKRKKPARKEKPTTEAHTLLRQIRGAAEEVFNREMTSDEEQEILHARATALARESRQAEAEGESLEVLEFLLAHETYGIEMSCVRETLPLKDFTPVPCTPTFVLGLIGVRGQIVSVI